MIGNQIHNSQWTSEELAIIYRYYYCKSPYDIKQMLPSRTLSAVRNKIKKVKYGI